MEINSAELKALEKAMNEAFEKTQVNLRKAQETADNALTESKKYGGVIEEKTQNALLKIDQDREALQTELKAVRDQVIELAQRLQTKPQGGSGAEQKSIYDMIIESDEWKRASGKPNSKEMDAVEIGSFHHKTQIINATGQNQPLVPDQRLGGLIVPAEQRLYIRDLLPQARTDSNLVQFASEASFTNNARSQGDSSPGNIEGEAFAESAMTFTLSNAAVVTIGHWIPASRQVLSDAQMLQGHISTRLTYGLKLQEETQMLTGNGTAGTLNGLNNQAAAYSYGVTNDTLLDTLLKSLLQVSLSNYEASGFVLHPIQWYGAMQLKDTTGRYLFSDPQSMVAPRLWAKPVVPSQTMTQGKFLAGAFNLGAQIWDREDATVRISENVASHFIQNMVAILAEERLALTVYRSAAFVYGSTSFAG
jgi:HK97 family phage major capsid protein